MIEEFICEATKFSPDINNFLLKNSQEGFNNNNNVNVARENDNNKLDEINAESNENMNMDQNKFITQNKMNFTSINPTSIIKLREVKIKLKRFS